MFTQRKTRATLENDASHSYIIRRLWETLSILLGACGIIFSRPEFVIFKKRSLHQIGTIFNNNKRTESKRSTTSIIVLWTKSDVPKLMSKLPHVEVRRYICDCATATFQFFRASRKCAPTLESIIDLRIDASGVVARFRKSTTVSKKHKMSQNGSKER